jgi:tRNA A58 N-methylase Trm61
MDLTRWTKSKAYLSIKGLPELLTDLKYLLRRSFLGLPRREITEICNFETDDFGIVIPNYNHNFTRNASLNINDKLAIAIICNVFKPKTVIEIGTFRGETTDLLANNLTNANIYTLDLPPDFKNHQDRVDPDDLEVLKLRKPGLYIQNSYDTGSLVHQIYGDSAAFDFKGLNQSFDLAFIDGAHSYEYVKNDTEVLLPLMNKGGWLIWDDYSFSFPEIIKYVNTFHNQGAFHIYGTRFAAMRIN